jgi:hypothetical protein
MQTDSEEGYLDLSASQMAAIFIVMFLLGVATGYLAFHC